MQILVKRATKPEADMQGSRTALGFLAGSCRCPRARTWLEMVTFKRTH